ncbi:cyclopropane-fatty-acyl-phospholipid synthase family protein [Nocardia sp. CNY236]|uniref:SAM-dependent methyltransferase n=1 Tax=Nocardia sp. CNY236 TaxID=1169152 RepID=UPI00055EF8AF|nr:cyclopropane-fatty-acyl-phospholipid synthase family protein [Nocardia sp. CNY236]
MTTESLERGASSEAIQHHYDVDTSFYRLWLDPTMTYSCALWESQEHDDLESAQLRKLDYLLSACLPRTGGRLLDIGCGWGSAMTRALTTHDASSAMGLTLSPSQANYVKSLGEQRIQVAVQDWADYAPTEPVDGIISIGALEHFVKFGWKREDKIAAYRRFFESCHQWLAPGGALSLQTIGKGNSPLDQQGAEDMLFIAQHIFPESDLPKLSELARACERYFEIQRIRNDRNDYARTCTAWLQRLHENREQAIALVGQERCDQFERYLAASVRQFEHGHANLYRLTLNRVG